MFAPWRSQKSFRKHKAPTTGNSFIKVMNCKAAENIITLYKELELSNFAFKYIFIKNLYCCKITPLGKLEKACLYVPHIFSG